MVNLQAQTEGESTNIIEPTKVTIDILIDEDGESKHIVREVEIPQGVDMESILEQVQGLEGFDLDIEEGQIEVKMNENFDFNMFTLPNCTGKNFPQNLEKVAFLGVKGYTTNANGDGPKQVRLMEVIKDQPAHKAGLKSEDILLSIDGQTISTYTEMVDMIRAKKPGDAIEVEVRRDGKKKKYNITLGEKEMRSFNYSHMNRVNEGENIFKLICVNVKVEELSDEDKVLVQKSTGLKVNDANSMKEVNLEVYPNPGNGDFAYELKLAEGGELEVTVLDDTGKKIIEQIENNSDGIYKGDLDLKNMPKGSYLLIFKKGDKILSEKLIKS